MSVDLTSAEPLMMDYFKVGLATPYARLDVDISETGFSPPGIRDYLGTEFAHGERSIDPNERIGRCNELTCWAVVAGTAPSDIKLVHGSMHGPEAPRRIRHSWLVLRRSGITLVWEPAMRTWHQGEVWYDYARAWDEREYTTAQVKQQTLINQHYGPWHESRYP